MALQLNFNQMYFFYMAVLHKGIRNAAKALHVSAPAVSAQIKRLEESLGFPLLNKREGGKFSLSQQGQKIFPEVERLFEQADYLERFIKRINDDNDLEIPVGAHFVHLQSIMPKILPYYKLHEHDCPVQYTVAEQNVLVQKLLQDEVAVAFLEHKVEAEGVQCIELFSSKTVFMVCANNPLAHKGPIHLHSLRDTHIYLPKYDSGFAQCLEQYFSHIQFSPTRSDTFTIPIMKRLLRNSPCGAFFPGYIFDEESESLHLKRVDVIEDLPEIKIFFAYAQKNATQEKVIKMKNFLQQQKILAV